MMKNAESTLDEIGQILGKDTEYPIDGTLLYAQVERNVVSASIFKDLGNHVLYRWECQFELTDPLLSLWESQSSTSRWVEMEYLVKGGRFSATYTYPEEIDPTEDELHRRDRIVRKYFGGKPIVYPPMPPADDLPTFEL